MPRVKRYALPSGSNPLEEARAVRAAFPEGTKIRDIARKLKRSPNWVVIRLKLLKMPPGVQEYVAAGKLTLNDLEALLTLDPKDWLDSAHQIVSGDRCSINAFRRRKMRKTKKNRVQIERMIGRLFDAGIDGLPTRLLAWTAGSVSDEEIEMEIFVFSKNHLDTAVVEISDGNDHSTTEQDSRLPTGGEPGELEAGDAPDCPDDTGDLSPAGD